jgi:hypothetical protein
MVKYIFVIHIYRKKKFMLWHRKLFSNSSIRIVEAKDDRDALYVSRRLLSCLNSQDKDRVYKEGSLRKLSSLEVERKPI